MRTCTKSTPLSPPKNRKSCTCKGGLLSRTGRERGKQRLTKPILESAPPEMPLPGRLPKHVAIIMDGNGRWAKNRLLPREAGHVKGISSVRKVVRAAREL